MRNLKNIGNNSAAIKQLRFVLGLLSLKSCLLKKLVTNSMHFSRPVGWQDTAQAQNFEFPRENQCYKMRNGNGSASFLLLCSEKNDPTLDWTCLGYREEPAHSHGILFPLGLGEPRTWQGHFLGLFLPQCREEVTL